MLTKRYAVPFGYAVRLAAICAAMVGCTSWTYGRMAYREACKNAEWEQLYYDAEIHKGETNNVAQSKLDVLAEACPYHDIKPDPAAKAEALARVQNEFCAFSNAYSWGREGNVRPSVCDDEFKVEWRRGYRAFLVAQLEYLQKDGTYKNTVDRYLSGMNVSKKDKFAYNLASAEAETQAIRELNIKPVAEADRHQKIEFYKKELDQIRSLPF